MENAPVAREGKLPFWKDPRVQTLFFVFFRSGKHESQGILSYFKNECNADGKRQNTKP